MVVSLGCSNSPENYIEHLNGYWEIDEVTLPDGTRRDYGYNDTIDFIELTDSLTGFRKKLKPNFDGTFSTSLDAEALKVIIEHDSFNIYYSTPYSKWKETILEATENRMVVKNQDDYLYVYKRYEPLIIE
jgi:hypothetical protein